MFSSPSRPTREFSLAELVAKIQELEQRHQPASRNAAEASAASRSTSEQDGETTPRFEPEVTE